MLIWGNSAYFWNTVFSWRLFGGSLVMSSPPKITFPVFGDSNPPMMRSVVVLPQPLGPKSVTENFPLLKGSSHPGPGVVKAFRDML